MAKDVNLISIEHQELIRKVLSKKIEDNFNDIEFVDMRFYKEYGKLNLEILIWKKSGISLDDCSMVHDIVSCELDKYEDLFVGDYVLNVSSQGLDRKIVTDDDFRRALDTEIECKDVDKNTVHGILKSYDDEQIVISLDGKKPQDKTLLRKNLTKVQAYIRF